MVIPMTIISKLAGMSLELSFGRVVAFWILVAALVRLLCLVQ
jgi:hypothetical protein